MTRSPTRPFLPGPGPCAAPRGRGRLGGAGASWNPFNRGGVRFGDAETAADQGRAVGRAGGGRDRAGRLHGRRLAGADASAVDRGHGAGAVGAGRAGWVDAVWAWGAVCVLGAAGCAGPAAG